MTRPPQTRPVTVLTGFLGSGKTTLLNRLLKERPGTRFGLVVNEFGEASLESQLVVRKSQPLHELPSGCLCCVSDGDLRAALDALVRRDPSVAHIVVEASGLSNPGPLLGVLTAEGSPYELAGVFCLADASSFLAHEKEFAALGRQLAFADAVFLTKTDLVTPEAADRVRARLTEVKPGVRILDTAGRLPWAALFEAASPTAEAPGPSETVPRRRFFQGGRHHDVDVLEFETHEPLDPDRLGALFGSLDRSILRAKGIVHLAEASGRRYKYLVQYTGAQKQLYSRPWARNEIPNTSLVFLGTGFDAAALRSRLEACTVPGGRP